VRAIGAAFDEMTQRIEAQTAREQQQASDHREMMAGVAHDLRTPLTALHGHLEALAGRVLAESGQRERVLAAALAQSDKVRRLSQQLFELAALQSTDQVLIASVSGSMNW
jgi:signal transduction histidine kinase